MSDTLPETDPVSQVQSTENSQNDAYLQKPQQLAAWGLAPIRNAENEGNSQHTTIAEITAPLISQATTLPVTQSSTPQILQTSQTPPKEASVPTQSGPEDAISSLLKPEIKVGPAKTTLGTPVTENHIQYISSRNTALKPVSTPVQKDHNWIIYEGTSVVNGLFPRPAVSSSHPIEVSGSYGPTIPYDHSSVIATPQRTESTIEVTSNTGYDAYISTPTKAPPMSAPKTSSRRAKQYMLADGSTVSGKGLGRGRPGIKRGPRSVQIEDEDSSVSQTVSPAPIMSQQLTQASPSNKRKRAESTSSHSKPQNSTSTSVTSTSRESSVEYNPTVTHTRSGRQTQKPPSLVVQAPEANSPTSKRPKIESANQSTNTSPSAHKTHPKIKRRVYRGREQLALCEHCLRGHGPHGNVIVFCDACNKCWHQRCHEPQVSKEIVADTKVEWFCADCDRILHGAKKNKKPTTKPNSSANVPLATNYTNIATTATMPTFSGPLIGGATLKRDQKLAYLNTISKDKLMNLILNASDLAPALPLFQTPTAPPVFTPLYTPQAQFTSNYVTPVSKPPDFANSTAANNQDNTDDRFEEYFDEHAALYPKPGNGVKLPPESTDMHMLLEGRDSRTFSHWVRSMPGNEFNGSGNVITVKC